MIYQPAPSQLNADWHQHDTKLYVRSQLPGLAFASIMQAVADHENELAIAMQTVGRAALKVQHEHTHGMIYQPYDPGIADNFGSEWTIYGLVFAEIKRNAESVALDNFDSFASGRVEPKPELSREPHKITKAQMTVINRLSNGERLIQHWATGKCKWIARPLEHKAPEPQNKNVINALHDANLITSRHWIYRNDGAYLEIELANAAKGR